MENDSIRASGSDTLIDIWVEGKLRAICVTRAAIETFLGRNAGVGMSDDDRCEFVRTHLPQLVNAVKTRLRDGNPTSDTVVIEAGQLGGVGDRRKGERRRTERRKSGRAAQELPQGERRRTERRKGDRRQSPRRGDD